MTIISGRRVIKTPCCGRLLTTPRYLSTNNSAKEYWTDGRTVGSLAPQSSGLRRCTCGSYFLLRQAEYLDEVPHRKPRAPPDWETREIPSQLPGRSSRQYYVDYFDTRPAAVIDAEEKLIPPLVLGVTDAELSGIIMSKVYTAQVLFAVRLLYWRYLNDSFRETYRAHKESDPTSFPSFSPTSEQIENMEQLLPLWESTQPQDWLLSAELHRELGHPEKALECLNHVATEQQSVANMLKRMIAEGVRGPVRYSLD